MKTCAKCKTIKPKSDFSKSKALRDGLQSSCKECQNNYYAANADRIRERNRKHYAANSDRITKKQRDRYEANEDGASDRKRQYYRDNRELIAGRHKQYYADNFERFIAYSRRRRAMLLNAEGDHTSADVRRLLELQRHKCAYCKTCVKGGYHVDHIVALSKGGGNGPDNLQILCPPCNLSKNAKCPIEFAQEKGLLL